MVAFDKEFINKCKKAEQSAQKMLFERLYAPMFRLCYRYIGKQAEAEDCMMKAFMKVFQKMDSFEYKDENSFFYWIKKIMINESLMELRKQSNLSLVPHESFHEIADEADVLQYLDAEEIYEMILKLPSGYRTVFNLNIIEGYSHKEIAAMLNITESTSRTQLAKARKSLRVMLGQIDKSYGTFGR